MRRVYFLAILVFSLSGCAHIDRAALATMADQAKEEEHKSQALQEETKSFEAVRKAIVAGELRSGMSADEIIGRFGPPVVTLQKEGEKWLYKPGGSSWFNPLRIELYLDTDRKLARWLCRPSDICPEPPAAQ